MSAVSPALSTKREMKFDSLNIVDLQDVKARIEQLPLNYDETADLLLVYAYNISVRADGVIVNDDVRNEFTGLIANDKAIECLQSRVAVSKEKLSSEPVAEKVFHSRRLLAGAHATSLLIDAAGSLTEEQRNQISVLNTVTTPRDLSFTKPAPIEGDVAQNGHEIVNNLTESLHISLLNRFRLNELEDPIRDSSLSIREYLTALSKIAIEPEKSLEEFFLDRLLTGLVPSESLSRFKVGEEINEQDAVKRGWSRIRDSVKMLITTSKNTGGPLSLSFNHIVVSMFNNEKYMDIVKKAATQSELADLIVSVSSLIKR